MLWDSRCKLINKVCKVNSGFSFSYSESHGTEHLRMIHWLIFILNRKSMWDNDKWPLLWSNLSFPIVHLWKSPSHTHYCNEIKSAVVQLFIGTVCGKPHRTLQFENQLSSRTPHIFPDALKSFWLSQDWLIVFSMTLWNLDVSNKIGKAFRECLTADILCSKSQKLIEEHKINEHECLFL